MFGIGFPELLLILVVALLVVGPSRLPQVARSIGKALGEFRRMADDVKETIENELIQEDEKLRRRAQGVGEASAKGAPGARAAAPARDRRRYAARAAAPARGRGLCLTGSLKLSRMSKTLTPGRAHDRGKEALRLAPQRAQGQDPYLRRCRGRGLHRYLLLQGADLRAFSCSPSPR